MRNSFDSDKTDAPITAKIRHAEASFQRSSPTGAMLRLAYAVAPAAEQLADGSPESLANAVEILCEAEVQNTRAALKEIGDTLSSQLDNQGVVPHITQHSRDHDERAWSDRGTSFLVQSSVYENEQTLTGYEGASDAAIVRGSIDLLIAQRECSIRKLYQKILADATAKRTARNASRTDNSDPRRLFVDQLHAILVVCSPVESAESPPTLTSLSRAIEGHPCSR